MREVPIVGMGHSLGTRLQAVSCSDPHISKRCLSMGKRDRLIRSGRDWMVYLGFTNWSTRSLIPGMESLDGAARTRREAGRQQRRQREQQEDRIDDGSVGWRNNVWDDRTACCGTRQEGRDINDNYDGAGCGYGQYDGGHNASEDLKRPWHPTSRIWSPPPSPRSGTTCWHQLGGTVSAASIISSFSSRRTPLTRDRGWCGRSPRPAMPRAAVQQMQ
jgi:hypothetical protein